MAGARHGVCCDWRGLLLLSVPKTIPKTYKCVTEIIIYHYGPISLQCELARSRFYSCPYAYVFFIVGSVDAQYDLVRPVVGTEEMYSVIWASGLVRISCAETRVFDVFRQTRPALTVTGFLRIALSGRSTLDSLFL